jgi:hypothetical protein
MKKITALWVFGTPAFFITVGMIGFFIVHTTSTTIRRITFDDIPAGYTLYLDDVKMNPPYVLDRAKVKELLSRKQDTTVIKQQLSVVLQSVTIDCRTFRPDSLGNYTVVFSEDPEDVRQGKQGIFRFRVEDAQGKPVRSIQPQNNLSPRDLGLIIRFIFR